MFSDDLSSEGEVNLTDFVVGSIEVSEELIPSWVENAVVKPLISVGSLGNSVETCTFVLVEAKDAIWEIGAEVPDSVVIFEVNCAAVVDASASGAENIVVVVVGFSEDCSVPCGEVLSLLFSVGDDMISAAVPKVTDAVGTVDMDSV